MTQAASWKETIYPMIDTPEHAAMYLDEVLTLAVEDNNPELFLSAMRDVIEAGGGLPNILKKLPHSSTEKFQYLGSFFRPLGLQPYV